MKNLMSKNFKLTDEVKMGKKIRNLLIGFLGFMAVVAIGNYHIVLNATDLSKNFIFIKRPYFGFSDILGDVNACTGAPYYIVMSNHPSLCRSLQNAGYLESEEARSQRIENETTQGLQLKLQQYNDCLKSCDGLRSFVNLYSSCVNDCGLTS